MKLEKGMFRLNEDLETFCKKNNLEVETWKCEKCGKSQETTEFYYCEGWACLETPTCDCGHKSLKASAQPYSKETKKLLNGIKNKIDSGGF